MTCGPVLTQSLSAVGLGRIGIGVAGVGAAFEHVHHADRALAAAACDATQASTHLPALASKHIGSGPGVVGLSGMQVQPLLPLRKVFIVPSALAWTIVALPEIDAGAADRALADRIGLIGAARRLGLVRGRVVCAAFGSFMQAPRAIDRSGHQQAREMFDDVMGPSVQSRRKDEPIYHNIAASDTGWP